MNLRFFFSVRISRDFQRRADVRVSSGRYSTVCAASDPDQLRSAREDIKELLRTKFCHPILVILRRFQHFL